MVTLRKLEWENIKREGRDLSVHKNSENKTLIFLVYFKQNFKTCLKQVCILLGWTTYVGVHVRKKMVTPIKNVTENYSGLPSKLIFMLTHTYFTPTFLLIVNMQTTQKNTLLSLQTKESTHALKIQYLHVPVEVFCLNPVCWCRENHKCEQNSIFHSTLKPPTAINI